MVFTRNYKKNYKELWVYGTHKGRLLFLTEHSLYIHAMYTFKPQQFHEKAVAAHNQTHDIDSLHLLSTYHLNDCWIDQLIWKASILQAQSVLDACDHTFPCLGKKGSNIIWL